MQASLAIQSGLDPAFEPASRHHATLRSAGVALRSCWLSLEQPEGCRTVRRFELFPDSPEYFARNYLLTERMVKFLLWQHGGTDIRVSGAPEMVAALAKDYAPGGAHAFDAEFLGNKIYRKPLQFVNAPETEPPQPKVPTVALGRHLRGCRIGFDLGGSDRKTSAVIDGKVVFSEEVPWNPYFERDPAYHLEGIRHSLRRAAEHLPRVDAIGGSAAGCYVNNEVRAASLFRGVSPEDFEQTIRRLFYTLKAEWNGVPFEVVNDGEVTALAGSMQLQDHSVLGISMGTSMAAGYVDAQGRITTWLNELAFAPVDYRTGAPVDEWSGDRGCGVQYFSQQGVARLAKLAGFDFPPSLAFPEQLVAVQEALKNGDARAAQIFETIGICFGHSLAHYSDFYALKNVLILGRVTSGLGGELILQKAKEVLQTEYASSPELANLRLATPDEHMKRHGQAVAAASLPPV